VGNFNNAFADPEDPSINVPIGGGQEGNSRGSGDGVILCSRQGGLLIFTFTETLGMVDCEVENTATEDVYSTVFQAVAGSSDSIYVSMAPGDYEITLTCANTIYYGEYTIE
jgi:hypothetical protein